MSSDPTRPFPDWWQQPGSGSQPPQDTPPAYQGPPAYQEQQDSPPAYQASQEPATNVYRGSQLPPAYQATQGPQSPPPIYQGSPGPQAPAPVYQGTPPLYQGGPAVRRRRRRWPVITLIVIIVLLVVADRAAAAITENEIASQIQSNLDLSGKPHVTIQGIPFLTQLAARDFHTVDINATDETTGPLEIANLTATIHGMHILSLNSARLDQFSATALVTFTALANAGGIPSGITLSADGPNRIKATVSFEGFFSDTAIAEVTRTGPDQVNVKVIDAGGIPPSLLGSLMDFNVHIPKLPAGVSIQSVSVTQQGVQITAAGKNVSLSQ